MEKGKNEKEIGFNPMASLWKREGKSKVQHNGTKRFKKARETFTRFVSKEN